MRVHTSDSHKERSPSGQCAAISIPREGKLSQAKRERYLRKRKSLSLSFSLSSLSRYRSYRDCFRERLAKEDRDAVHRREYSYHDAPPRSFSFRKRIHVVDRSIAQDATDRFYQTKRTLVSPIQRGDPFLSVRWVSLFFRSPPFIDVPSTLSWKGSWRGRDRYVLLFPLLEGFPLFSSLLFARLSLSGLRARLR